MATMQGEERAGNFRWLAAEDAVPEAIERPRTLAEIAARYADFGRSVIGLDALVAAFADLRRFEDHYYDPSEFPSDVGAAAARILDRFLEATADLGYRQLPPRVFVSHRQHAADLTYAERIACIAQQEGFAYWLDVHDPLLAALSRWPLHPARAVATALVIELALLNCSHVIAVVTTNSRGSLWIPYEYGRAKARRIVSSQSAAWVHRDTQPVGIGEYLLLGQWTPNETAIRAWLKSEARAYPGVTGGQPCTCPRRTLALP